MTQAEFNEMLRVAIATAKVGGYYQSRWTGEELDDLASGKSLAISGVYPNYNAIVSAFPNGAEGAYQAADTKNLYVWNKNTRKWENIGPIQGPRGENGTTFTPSVSVAGVISWLNNGGLANPSPVNIRGADGDDGVGIRSIGKIAGTGAPGTTDTYAIYLTDGSSYRFTVYQGAGAAADVPAVLQAAKDASGYAGQAKQQAQAAEAAKTGAESAKEDAIKAQHAIENMSASAYTLSPGSEATVSKTSVSGVVNLHFGIPQGEQGKTGPQGAEGKQGPPGKDGINGVAVPEAGQYAFNVDERGHLILIYTGDAAPDFSIGEDGHLYLNID